MALASRRGRSIVGSNIWPGFVDAMTTLLMILMFVLSIFMILQFALRETISTQDTELQGLSEQVASLADALGLERNRTAELNADIAGLEDRLSAARTEAERNAALVATLTATLADRDDALQSAEARITSFEAQVATLLSERDRARGEVAELTEARDRLVSDQEALNLALASARDEIDAQSEAARLAAARRQALEALIADLRQRNEAAAAQSAELAADLTEAERVRLAEAEAARLLRERLQGAEDELTAMTLALEAQRREAEETLTLLAAADAARKDLDARLAAAVLAQSASEQELAAAREAAEAALNAGQSERSDIERQLAAALAAKLAAEEAAQDQLTEAEERARLLAAAEDALAGEKSVSAEAQRKIALLNEQVAALRSQLGALQALLDDSAAEDVAAKVQIESLGNQLNAALARVAAEERRRAELEAAEKRRLEEEAKELTRYRSEFFGKLSEVLAGQEGVRVVGDRFVFSSEVLFQPASADLAPEGRAQIAGVVATLQEVAAQIPPEIDWIIRVDGHTDDIPLGLGARYTDNWELSQARALSVVRFMQDELGFPPERLAAAGFGEYRPVATGDTEAARAQNRRIELKLTER